MSQTQVEKDRDAVLVAKRDAHAADSSKPALTPEENTELAELKAKE